MRLNESNTVMNVLSIESNHPIKCKTVYFTIYTKYICIFNNSILNQM